MALFSRGDDKDALLKKIESGEWRSHDEKREWLERLDLVSGIRDDAWVRFLRTKDRDVVRYALQRLAGTGSPRTLDLLLNNLLKAPQPQWRPLLEAIHAIEADGLHQRLGKMLDAKRSEHRVAAVEVIVAGPAWHTQLQIVRAALTNDEPEVRRRMVRAMRHGIKHAPVYDLLRNNLRNPDDIVRHGAIAALAENPRIDALEDFFDLLPDEPPRIQELMIRGLARMLRGDDETAERVLDRLLPLLAANDERIRTAAAKLLASMTDKLAVLRRFMQWAKGIAFWLRDRAFGAVATVADNLSEATLELLRDEDLDVVVGATVMAGKTGDPRVVPGLTALIQEDRIDWWVKIGVLEAIAKFNTREARVVLLRSLDDEHLGPAAIAALGARADESALPRLLEFLQSEKRSLRLTVIHALAHYQDPQLIPHMESLALKEMDDEVRISALELLDSLGPSGVAAAASVRGQLKKGVHERQGKVTLRMENTELNQS